jgi:hypothetical protein
VGKIALWRTIAAAYRFTFGDVGRFLRISAIWLGLQLALQAVGAAMGPEGAALAALHFVLRILAVAGSTAFSVAWCRAILMSETSGGWATLRFGRREWRFLGNSILIGLIVVLPGIPFGWAVASGSLPINLESFSSWQAIVALSAIGVLMALIAVSRLSLAFPAVAVEETGEVLDQAWKRGRGNTVRLFLGWIIGGVPFSAINVATSYEPQLHQATSAFGLITVELLTISDFFGLAVTAGFLSYSYQQLSGYSSEAQAVNPAPA